MVHSSPGQFGLQPLRHAGEIGGPGPLHLPPRGRGGSGGEGARCLSAWLVLWFESSYCQQLCGVTGQFIKVPADLRLSLSVSLHSPLSSLLQSVNS